MSILFGKSCLAMVDKFKLVYPFINGKSVLDVGAIGHKNTNLTHQVRSVALYYTGIDTQESSDIFIYEMDAQDFDLGYNFDTILALDIIEHLENAGRFLKCCHNHMHTNSTLIITTPNIMSWRYQINGRIALNNEHVAGYQKETLRALLRRMNFKSRIRTVDGGRVLFALAKI